MTITTTQLKEIRQEFAALKPASVTLDGNRTMSVKEAVFALAPPLERMKKRRQEKVSTLQDIAGDYLIPDTSDGLKPEKAAPEQDAIRESRQQQQQISRQIASFYQEPKDNPRVSDLERQVKELNENLDRERKGQVPLDLME